jgi:hypothetical protein
MLVERVLLVAAIMRSFANPRPLLHRSRRKISLTARPWTDQVDPSTHMGGMSDQAMHGVQLHRIRLQDKLHVSCSADVSAWWKLAQPWGDMRHLYDGGEEMKLAASRKARSFHPVLLECMQEGDLPALDLGSTRMLRPLCSWPATRRQIRSGLFSVTKTSSKKSESP